MSSPSIINRLKLSVIIPCYNAANTLTATINSIEQEMDGKDSFEIIIVNDGSTDNSLDIIKSLCQRYCNIRYFDRENGGVSSARNFGLKRATAEYVWFFDADDLLFNNVGNAIWNILNTSEPDILRFNSVTEDYSNTHNINSYSNSNNYNIIFKGFYSEYLKHTIMGFACWSVIVKRKILLENNIEFDISLSIGEDVLWNIKLASIPFWGSDLSFIFTNLRVVRYIVRADSALNTTDSKRTLNQLRSLISYNDKLEDIERKYNSTYLQVSINSYLSSAKRQMVTKLLSYTDLQQKCAVARRIPSDTSNTICKFYLSIYRYQVLLKITQILYRNFFLKYIKPRLGRN